MNRKLNNSLGALLVVAFAYGCQSSPTTVPSAPGPTADLPEVPVVATVPPGGRGDSVNGAPIVSSYGWERRKLGDMPDSWWSRDGAAMVQLASGRILLIGGWSAYEPWGPNYIPDVGGGDRITNEVWKSDDLGVTWSLLLPHVAKPPTTGPSARFPPGHSVGVVTYNGHAVVMGSDGSGDDDQFVSGGDVWQESNNGTTWTRVTTTAPTFGRALFMAGNYQGAIIMMGGQAYENDPTTAFNDVWKSTDGGITWTQLANAPWSPRGMIYRPVEHAGKLYVVGGGNYGDIPFVPATYNGVYAFDGTTWETILPENHKQFAPAFYQPLISLDGRLWLFNGYDVKNDTELSRALFSDDNGKTWTSFVGGPGGDGSHADSLVAAGGRILRLSGNLSERAVWEFARTK